METRKLEKIGMTTIALVSLEANSECSCRIVDIILMIIELLDTKFANVTILYERAAESTTIV